MESAVTEFGTQVNRDLESAVDINEYEEVTALVLYWQDGEAAYKDDAAKVATFFECDLNYKVVEYAIPSQRSLQKTQQVILRSASHFETGRGLLILYYNGESQIKNDFSRASSRKKCRSIWAANGFSENDPTILWHGIERLLLGLSNADILLILDCLTSPSVPYEGTNCFQVLVAGATETARLVMPGPRSFTRRLLEEFKKAISSKGVINLDEVHDKLARERIFSTPPVYVMGRGGSPIHLKPLERHEPDSVEAQSSHTAHLWTDSLLRAPFEEHGRVTSDSGYASIPLEKAFGATIPPNDVYSQEERQLGLYMAPTEYSPSDITDLPSIAKRGYISDLSAGMVQALEACKVSEEKLRNIVESLSGLLRAFALKIGYKAQSQAHRDVSYFVHKHRQLIEEDFKESVLPEKINNDDKAAMAYSAVRRLLDDNEFSQDPNSLPEQSPTNVDEGPSEFQETETTSHALDPTTLEEDSDPYENEETTSYPYTPGPYRDLIAKSAAYRWLLSAIQREATLARGEPDITSLVRDSILAALPSYNRVDRRLPSLEYRVTFHVNWDIDLFLDEQHYDQGPDQSLAAAVTLTGSSINAQALTTAMYLSQTWPASGASIMQLICDAVQNGRQKLSTCKLPDETGVELRIERPEVLVTATGTVDSVIEVGQQFAWLGAALRASPFPEGLAECTPFVASVHLEPPAPNIGFKKGATSELSCRIAFDVKKSSDDPDNQPGQCWQSMFRNPTIVRGYPILAKSESSLGLEMPLSMMACLSGSERILEFDQNVFMKGFSAMFIATKLTGDILVWHYIRSKNGARISYLDHEMHSQHGHRISLHQVPMARHVVGWCSDCQFYAGAKDADYSIGSACLPRPHGDCILEKFSITGGKFISAGASFAVGARETPMQFTRKGYIPMLRWMSTKFVVLWDEQDKRGWLVNGTSALLHLVRASLDLYSRDEFSFAFLFDFLKMEDEGDHRPTSASKVLGNDANLSLKIWPDDWERFDQVEIKTSKDGQESDRKSVKKRDYVVFQDLVKQHLNYLEQIVDYQRKGAGQNGFKLKKRARKHLEGWDFIDLVNDNDPYARVATLKALGYGWVDFVRSIDAITLFGRGFGDIIRPAKSNKMCPLWNTLPRQRYYLAVSVEDLKRIMGMYGDHSKHPPIPASDLLWHCPEGVISTCHCRSDSLGSQATQHHDPVQVFCPQRSNLGIKNLRGPERLDSMGAVVFGHNFSWPYRWSEAGNEDLERGELPARTAQTSRLPVPTSNLPKRGSVRPRWTTIFPIRASRLPIPTFGLPKSRSVTQKWASKSPKRASRSPARDPSSLTADFSPGNTSLSRSQETSSIGSSRYQRASVEATNTTESTSVQSAATSSRSHLASVAESSGGSDELSRPVDVDGQRARTLRRERRSQAHKHQ